MNEPLTSLVDFQGVFQEVPCLGVSRDAVCRSLTDGLVALIADNVLRELNDEDEVEDKAAAESIAASIERPQEEIATKLRGWIEEHDCYSSLAKCVQAHIPWAISILKIYQSAWGMHFVHPLLEIGCFSLLAPAIGMGVGPWDNYNPEDFGIEFHQQCPYLGLHELDSNAIRDLILDMLTAEKLGISAEQSSQTKVVVYFSGSLTLDLGSLVLCDSEGDRLDLSPAEKIELLQSEGEDSFVIESMIDAMTNGDDLSFEEITFKVEN